MLELCLFSSDFLGSLSSFSFGDLLFCYFIAKLILSFDNGVVQTNAVVRKISV